MRNEQLDDVVADHEMKTARLPWTRPKLRTSDAREAQADHGETHFDGIGFS